MRFYLFGAYFGKILFGIGIFDVDYLVRFPIGISRNWEEEKISICDEEGSVPASTFNIMLHATIFLLSHTSHATACESYEHLPIKVKMMDEVILFFVSALSMITD